MWSGLGASRVRVIGKERWRTCTGPLVPPSHPFCFWPIGQGNLCAWSQLWGKSGNVSSTWLCAQQKWPWLLWLPSSYTESTPSISPKGDQPKSWLVPVLKFQTMPRGVFSKTGEDLDLGVCELKQTHCPHTRTPNRHHETIPGWAQWALPFGKGRMDQKAPGQPGRAFTLSSEDASAGSLVPSQAPSAGHSS